MPDVVQPAPASRQPAQRGKPEPVPDARQPEPRPPVAAERAPAPQAQPQPAPTAESRGRGPKPAASAPGDKKKDKDEPDWGDLPKGSRADLLGDIAGILDEAITNIDDVSRRDEKNPLISRALRKLTAATRGYVDQLTALKNQSKDPDESSAIERALDNANQIIEAGSKLPAPSADENKKKKKP